jgi:RHS repeat-associated protein
LREVSTRYVAADALGQTEWGPYPFTHDDSGNPNPTVHANTTLADASGVGAKTWSFFTPGGSTPAWEVGLASQYAQLSGVGGTVLSSSAYTWAQDGAGNPYVGTTATTLDGNATNYKISTVQTLDSYGNVLTQKIYDYGNATTPVRTYTNVWKHSLAAAYDNAYLRSLPVSSTVTDSANNTVTLVSNTYDGGTLAAVSGTPAEFDAVQGSSTNHVRGLVTQTVSPGSTVNYTYDVTGHMVTGANGVSGTGASLTYTATTNFAAPDAAAPMAGSGTDVANGHTVTQASGSALAGSFGYNGALALVSSLMPNSATSSQMISTSTGLLTSSTSVHGATTNYTYAFSPTVITAMTNGHWSKSYKDGFGRDRAVEAGFGSTIVSVTETRYGPCACSPLGKAAYISLPYASTVEFGLTGGVVTASDGTSNIGWNSYQYDGMGRTLTQTVADTSATHYVYLGNTVKVTDPAGNWKRYTNDVMGNLVKVEEPNPAYGQADNVATNFVTNYSYDVEGHLIGVAMPRPYGGGTTTQTRSFNYNLSTGRLTSATNPENGTVSYAYYGDGALQSKTDAKGQKVVYSYDGYGRVSYIDRYPDGVTLDYCQSVALTYDSNANSTNGLGRLSQASTGNYWAAYLQDASTCNGQSVTETYRYTAGGQTTFKGYSYQWPVNSNPLTFVTASAGSSYSYDNEGHTTGYGATQFYNYTLDAMGRPVGMTQSNGTVWVRGVAYGPGGEMQTMQYKQGGTGTLYFTENRSYNSRAQLKELTNSMGGKSGIDLQYLYNAGANNGQAAQMNEVVSGEQTVYTYDALKRLIKAEASVSLWGQSYGYDGWGNLYSKTPTAGHTGTTMSLTADPATNRLTGTGFGYDGNGNATSLPNVSAIPSGYDVENRMGGPWYDQQNQPLYRGGVWNVYGLNGERLETDTQASGIIMIQGQPVFYGWYTPGASNVYFAGRMIASNGVGVAVDRLGSVRLDDSGGRYSPTPYGEGGSSYVQDLFTGYTRDSGTGLDYANQRWYSSTYGRFTSADRYKASAGPNNPGSWNRYAYVTGDPINMVDPKGQFGLTAEYCNANPDDPGCNDGQNQFDDCGGERFVEAGCVSPGGGGAGDNSHPDEPQCSIELYSRPAFINHNPGRHTYILVDNPYLLSLGYTSNELMLEGGPSNNKPYGGSLVGVYNPPGQGLASNKPIASNPALLNTNKEVGSAYRGSQACSDITGMLAAIKSYDRSPVPYGAIPSAALGTYNSNSFTYTLLNDFGLQNSFGSFWHLPILGLPYPGWGSVVPGLHP